MNSDKMIHWLIDNKLMKMGFDKVLNEQTVELTKFGEEINTILDKLKTTSKEAQATNELAAECQDDIDKDQQGGEKTE